MEWYTSFLVVPLLFHPSYSLFSFLLLFSCFVFVLVFSLVFFCQPTFFPRLSSGNDIETSLRLPRSTDLLLSCIVFVLYRSPSTSTLSARQFDNSPLEEKLQQLLSAPGNSSLVSVRTLPPNDKASEFSLALQSVSLKPHSFIGLLLCNRAPCQGDEPSRHPRSLSIQSTLI